jgi:hypothetical protein
MRSAGRFIFSGISLISSTRAAFFTAGPNRLNNLDPDTVQPQLLQAIAGVTLTAETAIADDRQSQRECNR